MGLRLAIDFDRTLVSGEPLAWRPGARAALDRLRLAGHHLILHSSRCNPADPAPAVDDEIDRYYRLGEVPLRVLEQWARFAEMRRFLQADGAWIAFDEVWQAPGKPPADLFLDDKAELPAWARIVAELAPATSVVAPIAAAG